MQIYFLAVGVQLVRWRYGPVSALHHCEFALSDEAIPSVRIVSVATGLCLDAGGVPNSHACLNPAVIDLPFCDATLPIPQRVAGKHTHTTLYTLPAIAVLVQI
jgi:hypothetical protein